MPAAPGLATRGYRMPGSGVSWQLWRRGWRPRSRAAGAVVVIGMPGAKRRTPPVVVREPRTAPLSEENRQQAITALTVMIHQWRSVGQGRSGRC